MIFVLHKSKIMRTSNLKAKINGTLFTLIILVFTILPRLLFSQNEGVIKSDIPSDKKGFLLVSIGVNMPLGNLADSDMKNPDAGLAKTGLDFRFGGGYRILKNWGLMGQISSHMFPIDVQKIADYMAKQDPGISYSVTSNTGWQLINLSEGVFGYFPFGKEKKLIFMPKVIIGLSVSTSPSYSITAYNKSNGVTSSVSGNQDIGVSESPIFTYLLGAGVNYNIGKRFYILANIDYLGSGSDFFYKNVVFELSDGTKYVTDFKMNFKSFNTILGFGLRLGKSSK